MSFHKNRIHHGDARPCVRSRRSRSALKSLRVPAPATERILPLKVSEDVDIFTNKVNYYLKQKNRLYSFDDLDLMFRHRVSVAVYEQERNRILRKRLKELERREKPWRDSRRDAILRRDKNYCLSTGYPKKFTFTSWDLNYHERKMRHSGKSEDDKSEGPTDGEQDHPRERGEEKEVEVVVLPCQPILNPPPPSSSSSSYALEMYPPEIDAENKHHRLIPETEQDSNRAHDIPLDASFSISLGIPLTTEMEEVQEGRVMRNLQCYFCIILVMVFGVALLVIFDSRQG